MVLLLCVVLYLLKTGHCHKTENIYTIKYITIMFAIGIQNRYLPFMVMSHMQAFLR